MTADHADIHRLIDALLRVARNMLRRERSVFAIVMTMKASGEIIVHHKSVMASPAWAAFQRQIESSVRGDMEDGTLRAVGTCVNITHEDRHVPDELPALAVRVEHHAGGIVHSRLPYKILDGGMIHIERRPP